MTWLALALTLLLPQTSQLPKPTNETTLARLRPGLDTLASAEKLYPAKLRVPADGNDSSALAWTEPCKEHTLEIELDEKGVIRTITVSSPRATLPPPCKGAGAPVLRSDWWKTGRGLALGDNCKRAIALYGEADSRGPSTQSGRDLELLYYPFDWAGPKVPQVMEVTCDRATGRVVQITLAFPSL
jgi:hypothetical protein